MHGSPRTSAAAGGPVDRAGASCARGACGAAQPPRSVSATWRATRPLPRSWRRWTTANRDVRAAAARSLGRLGFVDAALAAHRGRSSRAACRTASRGRRCSRSAPTSDPSSGVSPSHSDPEVRSTALTLLGLVGDAATHTWRQRRSTTRRRTSGEARPRRSAGSAPPPTSDELREALDDRVHFVRAAAAASLGVIDVPRGAAAAGRDRAHGPLPAGPGGRAGGRPDRPWTASSRGGGAGRRRASPRGCRPARCMSLVEALLRGLSWVALVYFAVLSCAYLIFTLVAWQRLAAYRRARLYSPLDELFASPLHAAGVRARACLQRGGRHRRVGHVAARPPLPAPRGDRRQRRLDGRHARAAHGGVRPRAGPRSAARPASRRRPSARPTSPGSRPNLLGARQGERRQVRRAQRRRQRGRATCRSAPSTRTRSSRKTPCCSWSSRSSTSPSSSWRAAASSGSRTAAGSRAAGSSSSASRAAISRGSRSSSTSGRSWSAASAGQPQRPAHHLGRLRPLQSRARGGGRRLRARHRRGGHRARRAPAPAPARARRALPDRVRRRPGLLDRGARTVRDALAPASPLAARPRRDALAAPQA